MFYNSVWLISWETSYKNAQFSIKNIWKKENNKIITRQSYAH